MQVMRPGTKGVIDDEIQATITSVAIHVGDYIQYQCAWWNGDSRNTEWFHENNLEALDKRKKKIKIGFHSE